MTAELPNINAPAQEIVTVPTWGRGMYELTEAVARVAAKARLSTGLCHIYVHHNTASLIVCERADSVIREELEKLLAQLVPDTRAGETGENLTAHLRGALIHPSLTIPVTDGKLALGRWQAVYIWEHKREAQQRSITVTVQGQ